MRSGQMPELLATAWLAAATLACAQIPAATLTEANTLVQSGQADKALALLTPLPTTGTGADRGAESALPRAI